MDEVSEIEKIDLCTPPATGESLNANTSEVKNEIQKPDISAEELLLDLLPEKDTNQDDSLQPKEETTTATISAEAATTSTNVQLAPKRKRKKSKKIKRSNDYPKFYRNAYVRYCDDIRVKVAEENPALDSVEITKLVASKWYSLAIDTKKTYLDQAKIDKERFKQELKEYKKQNPDVMDEKDQPKKKKSRRKTSTDNAIPSTSTTATAPVTTTDAASAINNTHSVISTNVPSFQAASTSSSSNNHNNISVVINSNNNLMNEIPKAFIASNCEVPIFTEAFLEHNKIIETELKSLRRNNIEIEQQNSVLMKHIENMENGVRKVEGEIAETRKKNSNLEHYLTVLRLKLSANFNSFSQTGWKGATVETVDKYFHDLSTQGSGTCINKAKDLLKKIDLKIT